LQFKLDLNRLANNLMDRQIIWIYLIKKNKKDMKYKILSAVLAFTILGCNSSKNVAKNDSEVTIKNLSIEEDKWLQNLTIEAEGKRGSEIKEIPVYRASNKKVNDIIHTKLQVSFNWANQQLMGRAELTIKPFFYPTNKLELNAKGFDVHKVELFGEATKETLTYSYDGEIITIDLDKTYKRTEEYTIYIEYTAKPEELTAGGSQAITSDKGLYFINPLMEDKNKMPQIWTQGETQASSCWFPTIDSPNEKTTQELYITVADKYKTLSNGNLISSTKNENGTRTDYWKQDLPHAPYLFMMAVGQFTIVEDSWTRPNGKKMLVDYYVEPAYEQYAKSIFGKTPKMIGYFSDLLEVEYPWDKYSQIVVRDYVSGAMENTSAVIHGDFLYRTDRELLDSDNESIIAHELFHHWFGDLVTSESWSNLPMNESFANYSQFLWDEFEHGAMEADKNAYGEMQGYQLSAVQGGYHDLIWFDYDEKEQMFDGHSYNKGGRILHMLRKYVGDEAFFLSLKDYLTKRKFNTGESHDLRLSFEEITGEDLNWYFNQWFFDKGHPDLVFNQAYDSAKNELTVSIEQTQNFDNMPLFQLPIDIDIYTINGKERKKIIVTKSKQDFTFTTETPLLVNIDATKTLLADKEDNKSEEQWIYQLNNAPLYLDKKEAIAELKSSKNLEAQKALVNALSHEFYGVKHLAVKSLGKAKKNYPEEIKKALVVFTTDKKSSVRADGIKYLEKYYETDVATKLAIETGVNDQSYKVIGESIKAMSKIDSKKAMELAKSFEAEQNTSVKNLVADVYASEGGAEQHDFFINAIKGESGMNKYGLLMSYKRYMANQDEKELEKAIGVYTDVAQNSSAWWIKMQGYQSLFSAEDKVSNRITELETELKNTDDVIVKAQTEKDIMFFKGIANKTESAINESKANETDPKILGMFEVKEMFEVK
jgi:aminopeptidase N